MAQNDVGYFVRQNARYAYTQSYQNSYIGQLGYSDPLQTPAPFRKEVKNRPTSDVDAQVNAR